MKISWRLTIALLVAAIVPLLIAGIFSSYQVERSLANLGEKAILQRAKSVAQQIDLYLAAHPELDPADASQLVGDATLNEISVQPVGETGYTAVFDAEGVTHFHPNPAIVGRNMNMLAEDFPEFWAIFEASLDGSPAEGYYDWEDEDGRVRRKYMYIVPAGDLPLRVAATTYIDEFSRPAAQFRLQMVVLLLVVALGASVGAFLLARMFSRPIDQLVETAGQIAAGDLAAEPPAMSMAEFEQLAGAFRKMAANLSSLIDKVRGMTMSLSSAAGQVRMTQKQHTADSEEQSLSMNNSSAAVEELATSSAHIAETSQQVVAVASRTQADVERGVGVMTETTERLESIAGGNREAIERVRALGELARRIGAVMDLIEDIATQTRLIAFNASIEASAAGEVGRRFAVVAEEVRRLAGDVASSTDEIRDNVEQIQTTTNEVIITSERANKEIKAGITVGGTMSEILGEIHQGAQETTLAAQQISLSTQQQQTATEQLLADLRSLTAGAKTIATGSAETVVVMDGLVEMAQGLNETLDSFQLPDADQAGPE